MDRLARLTLRARAKAVVVRMALKKAFIVVPLRTSFNERKIANCYQARCAVAHESSLANTCHSEYYRAADEYRKNEEEGSRITAVYFISAPTRPYKMSPRKYDPRTPKNQLLKKRHPHHLVI